MIWGDNLLKIPYHPFCALELYLLFFYSEGNVPISRQNLKLSFKGVNTERPHNFSIGILLYHVHGLYLDHGFLLFWQY